MLNKSFLQIASRLWHFNVYELPAENKRRVRYFVRLAILPLFVVFAGLLIFTSVIPMFPHPDAQGQVSTGFVIFSGPISGSTPGVSYGAGSGMFWLILIVNTYLLGLGGEVGLSLLDVLVYKRVTNEEYPWEDVIVYKLGSLFIVAFSAIFFYPDAGGFVAGLMQDLFQALAHVGRSRGLGLPLPFVLIVAFSLLLDDLFFYIGHRISHNVRFIWKLGHVNHHRTLRLNRLTVAPDFQFFFLNGSRGSFVTQVIGRAFFMVLIGNITPDQALGGAVLVTVVRFLSASTSHSLSCYVLFAKWRCLSLLEEVFVIGRVHYVHHSSLPEHNVANGCNFAATFSFWDKLFGTFVRAPEQVPPTGLFFDDDPPGNPWKFAFAEWLKLGLELRRNKPRHWAKILLGPADYEPPVPGNIPSVAALQPGGPAGVAH